MKLAFGVLGILALVAGCSEPAASGSGQPQAGGSSTGTASAAAAAAVPEVVSGVSIGPVRIGMTRKEVEALGLSVKPGPIEHEVEVGPYTVRFLEERVDSVYVRLRSLPSGLRAGGVVLVEGKATMEAIAVRLPGCGPMEMAVGGNQISCDGGRTLVLAGGPPGILAVQVLSERAASAAGVSEGQWRHPGMAMSFSYPDKLLKVSHKPDGATLESEVLGTIEDRSGKGKDKPASLVISVSVRVGKLLDVMKSHPGVPVATLFPGGTESSFKEEKGFAERIDVAGAHGYRIQRGSHDAHQDLVLAPLAPASTLEVVCNYVGDMAKPKVSMADQKRACARVVSSLVVKP